MTYHSDLPITSIKQYSVDKITISGNSVTFLLILDGQVTMTFQVPEDTRIYKGGQVALLYSRQICTLQSDHNADVLQMDLLPEFFQKYFHTDSHILCDSVLEPNRDYQRIRTLFSSIAALYTASQSDNELALLSLLYQFMDELYKNHYIHSPERMPHIRQKYEERIYSIQSYINLNYQKSVTLGMMADYLHLSPQYLSRFFRKVFQIRFNDYLNDIRTQHAAHALCHTEDSITDIALNNGFPNITIFNKYFRNYYGASPKEYRQKYRKNTQIPYGGLSNTAQDPIPAEPEKYSREIFVSAVPASPFQNQFCELVNAGYAQNFLHNEFRRHLLEAKKLLGFTHVRLEGLVSSTIIPRLSTNNHFYFSTAAQILDFMYDNQLIPFIELGKNSFNYLTLSDKNRSAWGYCTLSRFHRLLEAFLDFVTERYQRSWYSQWIFELWKTPAEPSEFYIQGYQSIEKIIHTFIPEARFGGPGHNISQSPEVLTKLFHAFQKSGIKPDFLSIHVFMIQREITQANHKRIVRIDEQLFHMHQKQILEQAAAYGLECPLYITEFNSSLLDSTFINASCFQSAWLCHTLLELHPASRFIGYWLLDDIALNNVTFRHMDINNPFKANLGLINKFGIRMPVFFAYTILNKLGNLLIEKGEDYCITCNADEHFQILAFHYCPLPPDSIPEKDGTSSLLETYQSFRYSQEKIVDMHLKDIHPGTYRITRYLLNQDHGSLLDIEIQGLKYSTVSENEYLRKTYTPSTHQKQYLSETIQPEERTIYIDTGKELLVSTKLLPHSVCLWDIVREI